MYSAAAEEDGKQNNNNKNWKFVSIIIARSAADVSFLEARFWGNKRQQKKIAHQRNFELKTIICLVTLSNAYHNSIDLIRKKETLTKMIKTVVLGAALLASSDAFIPSTGRMMRRYVHVE